MFKILVISLQGLQQIIDTIQSAQTVSISDQKLKCCQDHKRKNFAGWLARSQILVCKCVCWVGISPSHSRDICWMRIWWKIVCSLFVTYATKMIQLTKYVGHGLEKILQSVNFRDTKHYKFCSRLSHSFFSLYIRSAALAGFSCAVELNCTPASARRMNKIQPGLRNITMYHQKNVVIGLEYWCISFLDSNSELNWEFGLAF